MEILILGGTGVMGQHLTEILEHRGENVTVTSRKEHKSRTNVKYIQGNAQEYAFLKKICQLQHWDVIVDFMIYDVKTLESRMDVFLSSCEQYVFTSSARVYADCPNEWITEKSPRLLEVCDDEEYLSKNEYAIAKAKEENVLFSQKRKNWSIVRPSLTYGEQRLQLGVYEKENWLYRAMHGRSIVFSKDLLERYYTLSYGKDVAEGIAAILGKKEALGEAFHIVLAQSLQWKEILDIYLEQIEKITGKRPNVVLTERCTNLDLPEMKYQVLYGRYFNRHFDNEKISRFVDTTKWLDAKTGLSMCIDTFLQHPEFHKINWKVEAYIDKAAGETTPLSEIRTWKEKMIYLIYRYRMEWSINLLRKIKQKLCVEQKTSN
jgi:nucleoside-diphosphate-sugar epimerase